MEAQFEQTTAWPTPASSIYHTTNTPPHLSSPVPAAAQPEPLSTPAATSAGMLHILQQLQELVAQVGQLKQQQQHWQPRSRQQQQQHWQPPQQWQQIQWQPPQQQRQKQMQHYQQETFYYPQQFGPNARNCRSPCNWLSYHIAAPNTPQQGNY